MSENDLLIKIRTALESGGLDAAKTKLKELTNATKDAAGETAKHTVEAEKLRGKMHGLSQVIGGLKSAAEGGTGAVGGLSRAMNGLHGILGNVAAKFGAVTASFAVGWAAGTAIFEKLWKAMVPVTQETGSIRDGLAKDIAAMEELNKVKLDSLKKELETLGNSMQEALSDLDLIQTRESRLLDAKHQVAMAALETLPEDTPQQKESKQKRIADLTAKQELEKISLTGEKHTSQKISSLEREKNIRELKKSNVLNEADVAESHFKEINERASKPGASNGILEEARRAKEEAEKARELANKMAPVYSKEIDNISRQIYSAKTEQQVSVHLKDAALERKTASFSAVDRETNKRLEDEAKKEKERQAKDTLESLKTEMKGADDQVYGAQSRLLKERGDLSRAETAAKPKKGVLGSGVSKAAQAAVLAEQRQVSEAEAALQQMVAHFQQLATAIKTAEQQMKNANRD